MEVCEYQYQCRTCLDVVDSERCTEISNACYLDKTIKELIVLLVPEMVSTLCDDELICTNCLKVIKSTMTFIERCLEVEILIAESKEQEGEFDDRDGAENVSEIDEEILIAKPVNDIDQDHDYHIKNEVDDDCVYEQTTDENYHNLSDNNETRPIEIVFDSSMVNTEEVQNVSSDNFQSPVQVEFDDSSVLHDENMPIKLESIEDTTSNTPIEYIKSEEDSEDGVEIQEQYTCQTCHQVFLSEQEYIEHLEIHPIFTCDYCEKSFKTEHHYKRHVKVHREGSSKICEICGKFFNSSTSLNLHIDAEHENKIMYMCDKCPKIFKNKFRLTTHIRMVHEKIEQQQCNECGKLFQNKESCENHFRLVHLQIKPFVCDVCGREFGRKDYLQKHMYNHTGEPRPIQQRNKLAKEKKGRGKPPKFGIRLKDPGTPVNCKICGKMIMSVHLLKSHLHSHVKIRRHKCRYCELTFTLSNNRDRHQRIHEADPNKRFRCNICWKKMETSEELEKHLVGHYNRPPQHCCDICGEKFHRKYLLDNHHLHKHTNPGDIEIAEKEIVINNLLEYAHPYL